MQEFPFKLHDGPFFLLFTDTGEHVSLSLMLSHKAAEESVLSPRHFSYRFRAVK